MAKFGWDHIHLRSPNPEATAAYYERMFGAEVIRTMQQGKPRIDLKVGGANVFIIEVLPDGKTAPPPTIPVSGARPLRPDGDGHRRCRGGAEGEGRRVHHGAQYDPARRAHCFPARPRGRVDRAARAHSGLSPGPLMEPARAASEGLCQRPRIQLSLPTRLVWRLGEPSSVCSESCQSSSEAMDATTKPRAMCQLASWPVSA